MFIDETFDVGVDTRTPVNDSYRLPFRFTGTINKLAFKLGPSQMVCRLILHLPGDAQCGMCLI